MKNKIIYLYQKYIKGIINTIVGTSPYTVSESGIRFQLVPNYNRILKISVSDPITSGKIFIAYKYV